MDLNIQKFGGIRQTSPVADLVSTNSISAVVCRNAELQYTEKSNTVGVFSVMGNAAVASCDYEIVGQWVSVQGGVSYRFIYATDDNAGYLLRYDGAAESFAIIKDGLAKTDCANGLTIANGFYDWFVFTNGVDDYVAVCMQQEEGKRVQNLNAKDAEEREIRGLGLEAYDGRLVTSCGNRVHWSATQNIFDWSSSDPALTTAPAYQELDRDVTAIAYYNNALVAFTDEYSVSFIGNPGDASTFRRTGAAGGGCASYASLIKFDNKLLYFDYKLRNMYAYYLLDSGQTRPTQGLGNNVLSFFDQIDGSKLRNIELAGYISGDRSEIWFKFPTLSEGNKILIFDYLKQEWVERQAQEDIKALCVIGSNIYTASGKTMLREYLSDVFNGKFIGAEYKSAIINVGSDSNLKIAKMPVILTMDYSRENDFYIEFIYDDNPERKQIKRVVKLSKGYLVWADSKTDETVKSVWAESKDDENGGKWFDKNRNTVMFNLSGLHGFKQLQFRIYTIEEGQQFGIKRMEIKRVKLKTKTLG